MATIKAFTDIEQSKKLTDILPFESADHHYVRKVTDFMGNPVDGEWSHPKYGNPNSKYAHYIVQNFENYEVIPCWSLASLLDILPYPQLSKDKLGSDKEGWMVSAYPDNCRYDSCWHGNQVDACCEMILKLHEQKVFPELAESEDERIRKWLEKQGEQQPTDDKKLDVLKFIRKETCCGLAEANNALLKLIKVLKEHPTLIMDKPRKLKIEWEE